MKKIHLALVTGSLAAAAAAACGSTEGDGLVSDGTGGSAGSSGGSGGSAGSMATGGSSGTGGGGAGAPGTGGTSGSGGAPATGGSAGGGGSPGTGGGAGTDAGPPCAPPADPSGGALCLSFRPERMQLEASPDLDGQGVLVVEIFDTPIPDPDMGPMVAPIDAQLFPAQTSDGGLTTTSIDTLPMMRFERLPSTVYVRAIFVDNPIAFAASRLLWGTWIGGVPLGGGFSDADTPLDAVSLPAGQGTSLRLPMMALRRLTVNATLAPGTVPLDDGEGPVSWVTYDTNAPSDMTPAYGIGVAACRAIGVARLARVTGFVIGPGPHFISAGLNDYGTDFDPNPGSIFSLDLSGATPVLPAANSVTLAADQYSATASVALNFVEPLNVDAGAPPSLSCSGIGDAGTD